MPGMRFEDLDKITDRMRKVMSLREGSAQAKITVHMGTCGLSAGARKVMKELMRCADQSAVKDVIFSTTGCAGLCSREPMITIELAGQAGAAEADLVRRPDGSLLADAATPMDEVAAALGLPRPWPEDFAAGTLAGFILSRLDHIPHIGETFAANGAVFEVVDMDGRRIDRVLGTPPSEEEEGS